jgi:hypothetical protein
MPTTPLTFDELRLANMVHRDVPVAISSPAQKTINEFAKLPDLAQLLAARKEDIRRTLADMVIVADRLAAVASIDLSDAIRARFDEMTRQA